MTAPPTSLSASLARGLTVAVVTSLAFVPTWAIAWLLGRALPNWGGMLLTSFAWVVATGALVAWCKERVDAYGLLLVLPMMVMTAMKAREAGRLAGIEPVAITDLARPPEAVAYRLPDDVAPRLDLQSRYVESSRRGSGRARFVARVAPLVRPGWTPRDPVQAWAVCADWQHACREIPARGRVGVAIDPWDARIVESAVARAIDEHRLSTTDAPLLVSLHASLADVADEPARARYEVPRLMWLAWAVTRGGYEVYERARRRASSAWEAWRKGRRTARRRA